MHRSWRATPKSSRSGATSRSGPLKIPPLQEALRPRSGSPAPFDGVAELWLDSLDSLRLSTPEAKAASAALREDERRFIDLPASPIFVGDELLVVGDQA